MSLLNARINDLTSSSSSIATKKHRRSSKRTTALLSHTVSGCPDCLDRGLRRSDTFKDGQMSLTLLSHFQGNTLIRKQVQADRSSFPIVVLPSQRSFESLDDAQDPPAPEQLLRRHAIVPEEKKQFFDANEEKLKIRQSSFDNVVIVPHMQISAENSHLYNRAITGGGGLLAELQKAVIAAQTFYSEDNKLFKSRSPWVLKRLYEWSHRAKSRGIGRHVQNALLSCDREFQDDRFVELLTQTWHDMFPGAYGMPIEGQKRLQAVWELFHSELKFLYKQLLVIRNVYKEPLKKCQVEGCLLSVEPDMLFGNLDELCQISNNFCREFLHLLENTQLKGLPYNCTDILVLLFDKFSRGPSTLSAYQAYCINYKATLEYLQSVRQKDERFIEFENMCASDVRCQRLQLEDLLISPLHRITRLPILLKEIKKYTCNLDDISQIDRIIEDMQESLRSIDDSVQWLHNFERLQQLQTHVVWPSIMDLEPKPFIPDFLKFALSRQFCENLLAHPSRKLIHEGQLTSIESGRTTEMYVFLFNDMLLLTKAKKTMGRQKTKCTVAPSKINCVYIVQRQPVPLDSFVFCDVCPHEPSTTYGGMPLKNAFTIIHLTRFYQVVSVHTLQATNKQEKDTWIGKFQESIENYESIQLKDMIRCMPLFGTKTTTCSRRPSKEASVQTFLHEMEQNSTVSMDEPLEFLSSSVVL